MILLQLKYSLSVYGTRRNRNVNDWEYNSPQRQIKLRTILKPMIYVPKSLNSVDCQILDDDVVDILYDTTNFLVDILHGG